MQVPLNLSFRHIDKNPELEALIAEKVAKLEQVCPYLTSCRIAIEKPQEHLRTGSGYRVRIEVKVPPGHTVVASREPGEGMLHENLEMVVRSTFDALRRRLRELVERQRQEIKSHPEQQPDGYITRLFLDEGYGFVTTPNGREIYFHRNSVVNSRFEDLSVGASVRFVEEIGDKGPQASTLQVLQPTQAPRRSEEAEADQT